MNRQPECSANGIPWQALERSAQAKEKAMKVSQLYISNLRKTGEISVKNLMAYAEACGARLKIAATF